MECLVLTFLYYIFPSPFVPSARWSALLLLHVVVCVLGCCLVSVVFLVNAFVQAPGPLLSFQRVKSLSSLSPPAPSSFPSPPSSLVHQSSFPVPPPLAHQNSFPAPPPQTPGRSASPGPPPADWLQRDQDDSGESDRSDNPPERRRPSGHVTIL